MRRLLALDLDGTLLNRNGELSGRSRRALQAAQARGWVVFPVTARPSRSVLALAHAEGWAEVACSNGAVTLTPAGQVLDSAPLAPADAAGVVQEARRAWPGAAFGAEWGERMVSEGRYHALRSGGSPVDSGQDQITDELTDDLLGVLHRPGLLKVLVRHPALTAFEMVSVLRAAFPELSTYASTPRFAEVSARHANKARAVEAACQRHGLDWPGVVAFGDMPVDVPMLRRAGLGVAVANAHPDVTAAADRIAPSNDEDGVAVVIEELLAQPVQPSQPSQSSPP